MFEKNILDSQNMRADSYEIFSLLFFNEANKVFIIDGCKFQNNMSPGKNNYQTNMIYMTNSIGGLEFYNTLLNGNDVQSLVVL